MHELRLFARTIQLSKATAVFRMALPTLHVLSISASPPRDKAALSRPCAPPPLAKRQARASLGTTSLRSRLSWEWFLPGLRRDAHSPTGGGPEAPTRPTCPPSLGSEPCGGSKKRDIHVFIEQGGGDTLLKRPHDM